MVPLVTLPTWSMPDPAATWFVLGVTWLVLIGRWAYKAGKAAGRKERK